MKLIKLHYMRSSENEKHGGTVYINPDHIVSISEYRDGSYIQTVVEDDVSYYVQETPEQIIKRIEAAKEYPPLRLEQETPWQIIKRIEVAKEIIQPGGSKENKTMNIEQLKNWCKEQAYYYENEMDTASKSDDEDYYKYCEGMQYAYWSVYDKIIAEVQRIKLQF